MQILTLPAGAGLDKGMSAHEQLTERTGVTVYFTNPHSLWRRGSNKNTYGHLPETLPYSVEKRLLLCVGCPKYWNPKHRNNDLRSTCGATTAHLIG